jgi:hypothetical protein
MVAGHNWVHKGWNLNGTFPSSVANLLPSIPQTFTQFHRGSLMVPVVPCNTTTCKLEGINVLLSMLHGINVKPGIMYGRSFLWMYLLNAFNNAILQHLLLKVCFIWGMSPG